MRVKNASTVDRVNFLIESNSLISMTKAFQTITLTPLPTYSLDNAILFFWNVLGISHVVFFLVTQSLAVSLLYKGNEINIHLTRDCVFNIVMHCFHNVWNILGIFLCECILFYLLIIFFITCLYIRCYIISWNRLSLFFL